MSLLSPNLISSVDEEGREEPGKKLHNLHIASSSFLFVCFFFFFFFVELYELKYRMITESWAHQARFSRQQNVDGDVQRF